MLLRNSSFLELGGCADYLLSCSSQFLFFFSTQELISGKISESSMAIFSSFLNLNLFLILLSIISLQPELFIFIITCASKKETISLFPLSKQERKLVILLRWKRIKMHREGFEPSSVATSHLECDPLDRSGICAHCYSTPPSPKLDPGSLNLSSQQYNSMDKKASSSHLGSYAGRRSSETSKKNSQHMATQSLLEQHRQSERASLFDKKYERKPASITTRFAQSSSLLTKKPNQSSIKSNHTSSLGGSQRNTRYKKYNLDTKNVPFEQRSEAQLLEGIQAIRSITMSIFAILLIFYLILTPLTHHQGDCPDHADCGVYIHCHSGYELKGDSCELSKWVVESTESICLAALEKVEFEYGDQECLSNGQNFTPTMAYDDIFREFEVSERVMLEYIYDWLASKDNQVKHNFKFHRNSVIPLSKKYSLQCRVKVLTESQHFCKSVLALLFLAYIIYLLVRRSMMKKKAKSAYHHLKIMLRNEREQKMEINGGLVQSILGKGESEEGGLWGMVEEERVREGEIGVIMEGASRRSWYLYGRN